MKVTSTSSAEGSEASLWARASAAAAALRPSQATSESRSQQHPHAGDSAVAAAELHSRQRRRNAAFTARVPSSSLLATHQLRHSFPTAAAQVLEGDGTHLDERPGALAGGSEAARGRAVRSSLPSSMEEWQAGTKDGVRRAVVGGSLSRKAWLQAAALVSESDNDSDY